jgi:hypothetical protein
LTRLSIVKTNAAVFPVPDWDCPIIFRGLQIDEHAFEHAAVDKEEIPPLRILQQERESSLLNLGRSLETHVVDTLEEILVSRTRWRIRLRCSALSDRGQTYSLRSSKLFAE